MGSIDITIKTNDVEDGINSVLDILESGATDLIENILKGWTYLGQVLAPRDKGDLAESHIYELISALEGFMEPTAPHTIFVIDPTKAHPICPVNAKSLYWEELGHPLPIGRCVQHPGTPGNDYLETILDTSDSMIDDYCNEYLDKIEQAWGG